MSTKTPPWMPMRRLPPGFRGRRGYGRLLEDVPLRISVSGIRGKSALTISMAEALFSRDYSVYAKVTGTDPVSWKNGIVRPIRRDPRRKAVIDETVREVMRHWPMDAIVLENQAITPYTMRVFNEMFCRPHYLLVTNIRRDHEGDIARGLPRIAAAFGRSLPSGSVLVSGERDPGLREILRTEAEAVEGRFLDASPKATDVPGFENVKIVHTVMKDTLGDGLTMDEVRAQHCRLESIFSWRESALPGVHWFHGAEINDVDSTRVVLDHLLRKRRSPVTVVAYFRRDRVDRTASFLPYLADLLDRGTIRQVHLAGDRARVVARRLRRHGEVHVWRDDLQSAAELTRVLRLDCRGEAVFTVANAVPPWPRHVAAALSGDHGSTVLGPSNAPAVCQAPVRPRPPEAPSWRPHAVTTRPPSMMH
jgi:gamma-polyglutamate synthase